MTDVVTNTAAYVQPLLYANRQQALGVPNPESPQTGLALSAAASQQQQTLDSTQVAQASDDRSSLKQGGEGANQSANHSFANQLPTSSLAAKAPELASPTTGPAKARVDIPVFDITALTSTPASTAPSQAATPSPLASGQTADTQTPATVLASSNLTGGPTGSAQPAPNVAPQSQQQPQPQTQPQVSGILGPAAQIKDSDLAIISENIFGAAFAPTQLGQVSGSGTPNQLQKNFIFTQRKMFGDAEAFSQPSGKFSANPAASAASTAGSQFAVSAAAAQKLSDKVAAAATSILATSGDAPAFGKVSQTAGSANANPVDSSTDTRQSLYQRAQAVAQAFEQKSSNPAVKNLVATLESYALVAGIGTGVKSAAHPTVRVIA